MSDAETGDASREDTALRRSRMAQWSSLLALGVSALALAVGTYQTVLMQSQTRLMQTQARASVWPHVDIGFDYADSGDDPGFELHVENNGVGPAIVHSVQVSFDGKPVHRWKDLLVGLVDKGSKAHVDYVSLRNIVIPPSTNRDTLVSALRTRDPALARKIYDARERLGIDICYCSVYDDCWTASWKSTQPRPIAACPTSGDRSGDESDF